jgi:alkanesulfonate monooxygenase SsuD/methylene tetrahydromethanopterin reductase-like flavin-dependent oxidoreductase (luciferase family)
MRWLISISFIAPLLVSLAAAEESKFDRKACDTSINWDARIAACTRLIEDPKTVAEKILFQYDIFGNTRYLIYFSGMPHRTTMRAIELLGTQVAPLVRAGLKERTQEARFDTIGS